MARASPSLSLSLFVLAAQAMTPTAASAHSQCQLATAKTTVTTALFLSLVRITGTIRQQVEVGAFGSTFSQEGDENVDKDKDEAQREKQASFEQLEELAKDKDDVQRENQEDSGFPGAIVAGGGGVAGIPARWNPVGGVAGIPGINVGDRPDQAAQAAVKDGQVKGRFAGLLNTNGSGGGTIWTGSDEQQWIAKMVVNNEISSKSNPPVRINLKVIADLYPEMTKIDLNSRTNIIGDIGDLAALKNLKYLDLASTNAKGNIGALAKLTKLDLLHVSYNKEVFGNIRALADLTLTSLSFAGTQIKGLCRDIQVTRFCADVP